MTRLRTSGVTFGGILPRQNRRTATKAELQQQIEELQRKLKEAQAVAKDRDRDELEDAALREELEAYQEQASQERAEREQLHKVLETAEVEIADLREDLDQAHWELEECRHDAELNASRAKESAREEMKDRHLKEMSMKDEIISLLKEKLATERKNAGLSLGGESSASESVEGDKEPPKVAEERTAKKMTLPTLQKFGGDGDAFDRWLRKFFHYAELEQWTERQKLLQLELYLSGRAEQVYEVLPASAKDTFPSAVESLKKRLQPVANEALLSSQLMKRKQRAGESVSTYTQELEALFEKSYGKRQGMDLASKELLKSDLFVQGLSLKWQEKVLLSAATFPDALHQARAAEEQDTLLGELHHGRPPG